MIVGILTFVEDLLSFMTLQIYPCKIGRIFETWKRYLPYRGTFWIM